MRAFRRLYHRIAGRALVQGRGTGTLLHADEPISFWGGIEPDNGRVIDVKHPLLGQSVASRVLAIPNGRGSCTGSQVVLELILNGTAPAAILLREPDDIIALGAIVAEELFAKAPLPIVSLGAVGFARAAASQHARIDADGTVHLFASAEELAEAVGDDDEAFSESAAAAAADIVADAAADGPPLELSASDEAVLRGERGAAAQAALRIVARVARVQGAPSLVDVEQAHVDSCIHVGEASLRFPQRFVEMGGAVAVPTTLNAVSVDLRNWRAHGVPPDVAEPATAVGDAYLALGCTPSYTCAPYLLAATAPAAGAHVGWGESNAVLYANSVLGARTQKYADYLDVCIALTGRAPHFGCHTDGGRLPTLEMHLETNGLVLEHADDAFYGALGYHIGHLAGTHVPYVRGLEHTTVGADQLKAFSAAFGTSAAAALFHVAGHTPEARGGDTPVTRAARALPTAQRQMVDADAVWRVYRDLGGGGGSADAAPGTDTRAADAASPSDNAPATAPPAAAPPVAATEPSSASTEAPAADSEPEVHLVALGNPHFSASEMARLAALLEDARGPAAIGLIVTAGRAVIDEARAAGHAATIEAHGGRLVGDTCWCMVGEPLVPADATTLLTNSAKYAHYGPGLVGRKVRFASLEDCVTAAVTGRVPSGKPAWLRADEDAVENARTYRSTAVG